MGEKVVAQRLKDWTPGRPSHKQSPGSQSSLHPGRTGQKRSLGHRPPEGQDEDGMNSCLSSVGNSQENNKNCHILDCATMFSP